MAADAGDVRRVPVRRYTPPGSTAISAAVERLCKAADPEDFGHALEAVATDIGASPWSVYRWYKGEGRGSTPQPAIKRLLIALASQLPGPPLVAS